MQYFIHLIVLLSNIMLIRFLMKLELINLVKPIYINIKVDYY